ncbi:LuxR C-terminal-related transcriptional regulator [Azospirillum halopraeferens]|uniref:LuxR C-terminal-related transcriptional regulator n=1 Tax=Azospirillum halopraeferens TaxID=34010 RepID=UPI0003FCC38E|nr:response regulator transcription factor [Azospirillum halopraeferens]
MDVNVDSERRNDGSAPDGDGTGAAVCTRPLRVRHKEGDDTMEIRVRPAERDRVHGGQGQTFLVVDGHPLVRHGFALSVREIRPGASVIEAGTLAEALAVVTGTPGLTLVLFDFNLADRSGREGVRRMVEALGDTPLLVISASDEVGDIVESVRLGARGYILKTSSTQVLEHAISLALTGETFLPLPRAVLGGTVAPGAARGGGGPAERLTDRQRDVFQLLLAGHSNKEIARELGVLEGTVKVHVRAIMQKLGVRNRTQVAVVAARSGWFPDHG